MANIEDTTFNEIGNSGERMHGHTAVLVSGATPGEQTAIRGVMDLGGLENVPAIYICSGDVDCTLDELASRAADTGKGQEAPLPRAIIMSGLTDRQLHGLMDLYRVSGLPRPIWASVTPTTSGWTFKYLLVELAKEREELRRAQEGQRRGDAT